MNIFLWVLQVLLALHTLLGAVWKLSNSEQTMGPLSAIPHAVWQAMSVFELLCAVALVVPVFKQPLGKLAPLAAAGIAGEMLLFCGVLLASGTTEYGPMAYWLVVAGFCAFIVYGRLVLRPLPRPA